MANSYVEVPVTGLDSYTFPFPYIEQSHIQVYVGGILQTQGVAYTFTGSNTIEFSVGNVPTDESEVILIKRSTDLDDRLVTYSNTGLDADDLNLGSKQNFYLAQEAIDIAELNVTKGVDGITSVNGRLTNVDDPINDQDAATKGYVASQLTSSPNGSVYIQAQEPSQVSSGDLWVDTDTNLMYVFTPTGWANGATIEAASYNYTGADLSAFGNFFIIPDFQLGIANIDQIFINGVLLKETTASLDYTTGDWDRSTSLITFENALAADDEITITTTARMSQVLATSVVNVSNKMDNYLAIASDAPAGGLTLKESAVAGVDQTIFILNNSYIVGANNISVYINGILQSDYVETNSSTITFNSSLTSGDEVTFLINEFNASVIEQTIVAQAEAARDVAVAAKEDAEEALVDVTPLVDAVTVLNNNIVSLTGDASVRIEGGTSTNYLTSKDVAGVEYEVVLWTDDAVQIQKPINLVSPNGLVVKTLEINNLGELVFDGNVIS